MADNTVKVIISAVDNASKNVKNVQSSFAKLNKGFEQLTGLSIPAAGGLAIIGKGISEVAKFTKDSIKQTIDYNKQVREMAQVTGLGVEEISRIVQVGDDWGISIDALRTSLAFMNKTGVTPSVENLANLADEYVNTSDKSAFAEKAVKLLGRGYQTLIPLLALGGKGLREATGAVEDNLIVTEASIEASREYEVNVDKLTDAWQGFKMEVGNKVIPVLNDVLGGLNDQTDKTRILKGLLDDGTISMKQYAEGLRAIRTGGDEYDQILQQINSDERVALGLSAQYITTLKNQEDAANNLADATNRVALSIVDVSKASFAKEMIDALNISYKEGTISADAYNLQMERLMREYLDLPESTITASLALQQLKESQLGPGALTAEQYAAAVRHLYNELKNLDGTEAHTTIITQDEYRGGGARHHSGGSFMIPPGYPNDSFPLGAGHYGESGEVVTVTPTNNVTNNFNYRTNASNSNIMRDFRISQAMAG